MLQMLTRPKLKTWKARYQTSRTLEGYHAKGQRERSRSRSCQTYGFRPITNSDVPPNFLDSSNRISWTARHGFPRRCRAANSKQRVELVLAGTLATYSADPHSSATALRLLSFITSPPSSSNSVHRRVCGCRIHERDALGPVTSLLILSFPFSKPQPAHHAPL